MMKKSIFLIAIFATVSLVAAPNANAEEEGYGYTFEDDPLSAGGLDSSTAQIKVRPTGARATLIRPRTSFVAEMLQSVENL